MNDTFNLQLFFPNANHQSKTEFGKNKSPNKLQIVRTQAYVSLPKKVWEQHYRNRIAVYIYYIQ